MKKITFPLRQRMGGQKVTDLQDALLLLLERGLLLRENKDARRERAEALKKEREKRTLAAPPPSW